MARMAVLSVASLYDETPFRSIVTTGRHESLILKVAS